MGFNYRVEDLQVAGPAGDLARIRSLTGDVDASAQLLRDEEILALVPSAVAAAISSATQAGTVATYGTVAPHGIAVGMPVTVAGMIPAGYNGTKIVGGVPSITSFTLDLAPTSGLGVGSTFGAVTSLRGPLSEPSFWMAAVRAADQIAARLATLVDTTVGDLSVRYSQKFDHFEGIAAEIRRRAEDAGETLPIPVWTAATISGKNAVYNDPDRNGVDVWIGFMDYPGGTGSSWGDSGSLSR